MKIFPNNYCLSIILLMVLESRLENGILFFLFVSLPVMAEQIHYSSNFSEKYILEPLQIRATKRRKKDNDVLA